ncbi:SulP family inorganic anion transporter [Azovibrio restrictus]|uniref:SulP family inorganic anion transporter n=1 Tax=Azovibrio restrictus TaxID=146938 RepID=UPI0026EA21E6|nr:sulfate permease [Azovibrio restrictus]
MKIPFRPKLLDCLPGYGKAQLGKDIASGITVGVLALPLAMAFAIASGVSPASGIWTAIVAGFIISALGGSRVQIGGPTGAFIPIVYGIVAMYGFSNLLIATMLAGCFLLAMGIFRLGQLIRFIPVSVVIGFTNGIAVVIFMAQIKDFLGLQIDSLPPEFFAKLKTLAASIHLIHWPTLTLSLASLFFLLFYNRMAQVPQLAFLRRAPGPLAVLVLATATTPLLDLPVETIGSRFGGIPQELPAFALPTLSLETLGKLIPPAITIALLGAIESLLSARVADTSIEDRHDPNQELMAQGLANIAAPLFGGFAATGAIARTATNIRSGGRTPIAGIVHALVLLAMVLILAPLASYIPLATLSAIVVVVAINMGEWHEFKKLRRFSNNYRAILLTTFFVTVIFDLTIAVELGMALACLFFIYRMSELTRIERLPLKEYEQEPAFLYPDGSLRIAAWRLYGSLFFGAANKLEALLDPRAGHPEVVILDMQSLIQLDTTGLEGLENLLNQLHKRGSTLIVCGLNSQPGSLLYRSGFIDHLGDENVCIDLAAAMTRASGLLPPLQEDEV